MFSKFFIDRPRFAIDIALVMMIAGGISAMGLPVNQYPEVAPPQIMIHAMFPGADADSLAKNVGIPLENTINGVDGMLYMQSTSSSSGFYSLIVTFRTGTDPDMALVKVQNRIQQATPLLPEDVVRLGVTAEVSFSDMIGVLALTSPNGTKDALFLNDYAFNNLTNILKRVPGMGDVQLFGAKYSIRIWVDPERAASFGLGVNEIGQAVASQNRQAALGSVGGRPTDKANPLVFSVVADGRLKSAKEFENITLKTTPQGGIVKLKDVARIELANETYMYSASVNGTPGAVLALSQSAGSNAIAVMNATQKAVEMVSKNLPSDVQFQVAYDSTEYVRETIKEILITLLLTFSLVVLVCYVFLQNFRVTLIPVLAIPISLLATFSGLAALGFSINILTLFGLVLVIGTVVDDAILVVERVLFVMDRDKCDPETATIQAMKDITGPMIATTLVFLAIFVPITFMEGMTGVIYRQFAVTIAFSVVCSLVVALTLSPALCALLLRGVKPKTKGLLGWFNRGMASGTTGYVSGSMWIARRSLVTVLLVVGLSVGAYTMMKTLPSTFIPDEDQGMVFAAVQLPEGATNARTHKVIMNFVRQASVIPGVSLTFDLEGFNIMGSEGENVGSVLIPLEHWSKRTTPDTSQRTIVGKLRALAASFPEAKIDIITPPAISGLGIAGGLDMRLLAVDDDDPMKLARTLGGFLGGLNQSPEFLYAFSGYTADTPNIHMSLDREKAEALGVPVSNIFLTLQAYFGTYYINDLNIGSQVNKVVLQSSHEFRNNPESIGDIKVKNIYGENVPLESLITLTKTIAPKSITRYNLSPAASVTAVIKQGQSTSRGMQRAEELASKLPHGYKLEWSGMSLQERESGEQVMIIMMVCVIFAYLFLVAQYESWTIPLGVMLSLPVAVLGALIGIVVMGIQMSVYTQLGILLLIGLAGKNAILILEFAKEQHEDHGLSILDAAAEAGRERLRSVLMTALTCVAGVAPMLVASGAGAMSRVHVGTTMFFGMSIATGLGIFLIPGIYVVLQTWRERIKAFIYRETSKGEEAKS